MPRARLSRLPGLLSRRRGARLLAGAAVVAVTATALSVVPLETRSPAASAAPLALTPTTVLEGTSDGLPTGRHLPGTRTALPARGAWGEASPAADGVTYQQFDVRLGAARIGGRQAVVRWAGRVDPDRRVALSAWNTRTRAWERLAQARGVVAGQTRLSGRVGAAYDDGGVVHALVTGEDPFDTDLPQGRAGAFESPGAYDFSMVHFTDTQYLTEGAVGTGIPQVRRALTSFCDATVGQVPALGGLVVQVCNALAAADPVTSIVADLLGGLTRSACVAASGLAGRNPDPQEEWVSVCDVVGSWLASTPQVRQEFEQAYQAIPDWIAANADRRKIAYAVHSGDITQANIEGALDPVMSEHITAEFELASRIQGTLDASGVPNMVIAGNHDNQYGTETGPQAVFNEYFGPERYRALRWEHAEYGGTMTPGDNQNNVGLFSAGGRDFVVVGLSYGVTAEEAAWADRIFKRYPDRNGILVTHAYLAPSEAADGRGAGFSGDGSALYDAVVRPNKNVFLVLAGHEHGVGVNIKQPRAARGAVQLGDGVVEVLADYQDYTVSAQELGLSGAARDVGYKLGASFFRMLQFDTRRGELTIDTYSPHLGSFAVHEHDPLHRYTAAADNLRVPVDIDSRTTTLVTDALSVHLDGPARPTPGASPTVGSTTTAVPRPRRVARGEGNRRTFRVRVTVRAAHGRTARGRVVLRHRGQRVAAGRLTARGVAVLRVTGRYRTGRASFVARYQRSPTVRPSSDRFAVRFVKRRARR